MSIDGQADALGQIAGGPMIGAIGSGVSIRAALLASAALLGVALPLLARAVTQTSHRKPRQPRLVETETCNTVS